MIPAAPTGSVVLIVAGSLWLALWRRRWRLCGFLIIAVGIGWAPQNTRPDILVARDGNLVAVRNTEGQLALSSARTAKFTAEHWLLADGDGATQKQAAVRQAFTCDRLACIASFPDGKQLAYITDPAAIAEECRSANIIIANISMPGPCASAVLVIDRRALIRDGAQAIYLKGEAISLKRTNQGRGKRPWVH